MQRLVLADEVFRSLSSKTLFYPCSGEDWQSVVQIFSPTITQFWFADICYRRFKELSSTVQLPGGLTPAGPPAVIETPCDDVAGDRYYRGMTPFIRKQPVSHVASGTPVEINWYMRRGPSALRSLSEPIGIFLYRGDSNEGGGGTEWLVATRRRGQFRDVLKKLVDGGLIVTDGSNPGASTNNPYAAFAQFIGSRVLPADAAQTASPFSDELGNVFTCVGHIDCPPDRYKGPVLIWQLRCQAAE